MGIELSGALKERNLLIQCAARSAQFAQIAERGYVTGTPKNTIRLKELLAKVYDRILLEVLKLAPAYQYGKPRLFEDAESSSTAIMDVSDMPIRHIPVRAQLPFEQTPPFGYR